MKLQVQEDKMFLREDFNENSFDCKAFFDCVFENCFFHECDFRNVHFSECTFKSSNLHLVKLDGCRFQSVIFEERKIVDPYCHVEGCHFNNTCLVEAVFHEADLEDSVYHHADLSKADFRNATNYSIDPQTNALKKAMFSMPEALSLLNFF